MNPYRIAVAEAEIEDLHRRLDAVRLPEELPDAHAGDGMVPARLRELLHRWRHEYDWRTYERWLNRYPQVMTVIDGTTMHALQARAQVADRPAIMLLHGWPSSILEFHRIIEPLSRPDRLGSPAFDIVVPSLPGYGFSGPTRERGWGADRMADALDELMVRLGYDQYIVHGSDVGAEVATALGRRRPSRLLGMHLNLGGVRLAGEHHGEAPRDEAERVAHERYDRYVAERSAYATIQATRPQTVAYALTDSPVGQLAWIAEKFIEWSDPQFPVDDDDILNAASVYWFTRTAGSSARFYQENYGKWSAATQAAPVPTAIASFPHEIVAPVRAWAEAKYQVVRWADMPAGGHFSALEVPGLVIDSLRVFGASLA